MFRINHKYMYLVLGFITWVTLMFVATGCVEENISAKSDETVCVFDGDERSAQKLLYQIFPGEDPRHADSDDEVVRIPTSFRFYAAFKDRSIADAGAPETYLGYARGNTPVLVQGSFKFRFNTSNACEWYARHGRRNADDGDLGFNARSNEAASDFSPWVRWLNENFGVVGAATIKNSSKDFTWPELVYGNDTAADIQRDGPIDVVYGKHIGRIFTERLRTSLGGDFFCGTNAEIWAGDDFEVNPECPPILFETGPIVTQNAALMEERAITEKLRAELQNAKVEAQISAEKVAVTRRDERNQQQILKEQAETARLRALADVDIQKCIILARRGLDCDGKWPVRIVNGQSAR